jgi:hypothetical protein
MQTPPRDPPLVSFSVRLYQALLAAYPRQFEREYGPLMLQVFRDCGLRAMQRAGAAGLLTLWLHTFLDFLQSVVSEYARKEAQMNKQMKPQDIRMAGSLLIWGALAFVVSLVLLALGDLNRILLLDTISGLLLGFVATPFILVGFWGLQKRYGDRTGALGKNLLLAGMILGPLTAVGGVVAGILQLIGEDLAWVLTMVAPAVSLACLALFGILALYKRPLPRWNWLPVIAGLEYPLILLLFITGIVPLEKYLLLANLFIFLVTIQGIALMALGHTLRSDVHAQTPSPA